MNTALAGGAHHSVVLVDTEVWTTGANGWGQLGRVTHEAHDLRFAAPDAPAAVSVAAAGSTSALIDEHGEVWTAGANRCGQLGVGDHEPRAEFTATSTFATKVACGDSHTVALTDDGRVLFSGYHDHLPTLTRKPRRGSWSADGYTRFNEVHAGAVDVACCDRTLVVSDTGRLLICGTRAGSTLNQSGFSDAGLDDVTAVAACGTTAAVIADGRLWYCPRLGLSGSFLDTGVEVEEIACGKEFAVARSTAGTLVVCGSNGDGQLGLGAVDHLIGATDTDVGVADIGCGEYFTMVRDCAGVLSVAGSAFEGEFGCGAEGWERHFVPVEIGTRRAELASALHNGESIATAYRMADAAFA